MRKLILTMGMALAFLLNATAQDRTVTGRVLDENGVAAQGVSVTSSDKKTAQKQTKTETTASLSLILPKRSPSAV